MLPSSDLHINQAPPLHVPLRFFATAPFFLILCGLTLIQEGETLLISLLLPETVAMVHMITLGWITMVMFGAMYQMLPVLGGTPVPWIKSAGWVHALLIIGVLSLYAGIGLNLHHWLLLSASFGLAGALILFIVPVGMALIRVPVPHPTVWGMRIALVSLLAGLIMGLVFLGEYAHGFFDIDRRAMIGAHLVWTFFGWIGTLMVAVSFHVLPMFYLMPPFPRKPAVAVLSGLAASWILLPGILLHNDSAPHWLLWAGALPGTVAMVTYGILMAGLIQKRKRKKMDITLRLWQTGYLCVILALLLLAMWPVVEGDRFRFLFGVLYMFGWTSSIITGMLYRIVPFLTWFHRHSAQTGQPGVPFIR